MTISPYNEREEASPINGIRIIPLKKMVDNRGAVLHMLNAHSEHFKKFGEIYFSYTNPGIIKGWKLHFEMTQNFTVPVGAIKFAFYDMREGSPTQGKTFSFCSSLENYTLIIVPPHIWYSFKCISDTPALIANCATIIHTPQEVSTKPIGDHFFPYQWD